MANRPVRAGSVSDGHPGRKRQRRSFATGPSLTLPALILCLISSVATAAEPPLEAGFGEADITPALAGKPVYLAGFGQNRKATEILDPLLVRAVVLRHGETKIAIA